MGRFISFILFVNAKKKLNAYNLLGEKNNALQQIEMKETNDFHTVWIYFLIIEKRSVCDGTCGTSFSTA
jgi:hypothetical protein